MTKEERDILFADVSARLPYSPIFEYGDGDNKVFKLGVINYEFLAHMYFQNVNNKDADMLRPYLRPMTSMTDKEVAKYISLKYNQVTNKRDRKRIDVGRCVNLGLIQIDGMVDFLNSHHFDYRGLIEKGLALEAPEGTYNLK